MASVRRSTRLSNVSKVAVTPTTPSRQSDIWHRRQAKNVESDDDNEEYTATNLDINNENINTANKTMDNPKSSRRKPSKQMPTTPKTPRSARATPKMTTKTKRQLAADEEQADLSSEHTDASEAHEVSPAKQSRRPHTALPAHLISPSRLGLGRLSIDEKSEQVQEQPTEATELKESPKKPQKVNKYQNARRVLNSAETQNLPGREQQLQELRDFFTQHLDEKRSGSLYVSGQPGTGKTACLSLLLRAPEFSRRLQCVYINCTSIASVGAVYKKLCTELKLKPAGRTERDHLEAIQHHLTTASRMLLIVLDEIDQLCTSRQSVLYTIFEWPALPDSRLLLVGIANSLDLTDRTLTRLNARCELKPKLMHFPSYTKQQIVEIFKSRLAEADVLDVFPPLTLQLLAAKVSAVSGDVRRALDIGRRVVEIAEQQKNAGKAQVNLSELGIEEQQEKEEELKPVQVTQVAAVLNTVYGTSQKLQDDLEEAFPLQQKLMLCSLMLMLRNERNKDINMGRLHEVYRRVCSKRNIHSLDQAEFAGLVDLVETRGILRILRKKEPRLSKVQLQWDEEEVNAALSDKQLIASILDDTACLSR